MTPPAALHAHPRRVIVDLTPLLAGGENGGAKIFALRLVQDLAQLAPRTDFILLTRATVHEHLQYLDAPNVHRHMACDDHPKTHALPRRLANRLPHWLQHWLRSLKLRLTPAITDRPADPSAPTLLERLGADLLYCPFTVPMFPHKGIPTVCTLYDLQHKTYPEFFTAEERRIRDEQFRLACEASTMLVAISEYSRRSALTHGRDWLTPERVRTILIRSGDRLSATATAPAETLPPRSGERYFLYPANFWPHKNHKALLTAFDIACRNGLPEDFKLICTGALDQGREELMRRARVMGLQERTSFPGHVSTGRLASLLSQASGLIFPSLYEGFGMPIMEAMNAGIPVACSNTASLPEIAGEAALLFNPLDPDEMAAALLRLGTDEALRAALIDAGKRRASDFQPGARMAMEYWHVFLEARALAALPPIT